MKTQRHTKEKIAFILQQVEGGGRLFGRTKPTLISDGFDFESDVLLPKTSLFFGYRTT